MIIRDHAGSTLVNNSIDVLNIPWIGFSMSARIQEESAGYSFGIVGIIQEKNAIDFAECLFDPWATLIVESVKVKSSLIRGG